MQQLVVGLACNQDMSLETPTCQLRLARRKQAIQSTNKKHAMGRKGRNSQQTP